MIGLQDVKIIDNKVVDTLKVKKVVQNVFKQKFINHKMKLNCHISNFSSEVNRKFVD